MCSPLTNAKLKWHRNEIRGMRIKKKHVTSTWIPHESIMISILPVRAN